VKLALLVALVTLPFTIASGILQPMAALASTPDPSAAGAPPPADPPRSGAPAPAPAPASAPPVPP
jgi:hypothetical protein